MSAPARARPSPGGAARPLPDRIGAALHVQTARLIGGGGSPAQVWLVRTAGGDSLVVKVLAARDGIVDGHDLGSFSVKPRQIRAVHRWLPRLSPYYAEVVGEWRGPGWAAYAMPYYRGAEVTAPLRREGIHLPGFLAELEGIFRVLTELGYAAWSRPAPPGQFGSVHLDRARRRLPLLRRYLDPELFSADPVLVNGRQCLTLPRLLSRLSADDRLNAALQPARLHFPVHGDLNLGNLVLRPGTGVPRFVVLDPRGTLRFWDPVYDFAKSLFSLTAFEPALAAGFTVTHRPDPAGRSHYQVSLRGDHRGLLDAAIEFVPLLARIPFVAELDRVDPGWRRRLLYAHAVHCLAEAACRLSDRKPRAYPDARGWDACLLLARGLYLVGLVLLNDLVGAAEDVSPRAHLGWLATD